MAKVQVYGEAVGTEHVRLLKPGLVLVCERTMVPAGAV